MKLDEINTEDLGGNFGVIEDSCICLTVSFSL